MALILADRVRETSTTTGTGALSLAGAVVGYQTFSSAIGNTNTCYYAISNPGVAEWEVGIGTYATSGNTLTRTTILKSSNANAAVNFSAGTKDVFVTYPATKSVYQDASGNVTIAGGLGVGGSAAPGSTGLAVTGTLSATLDATIYGVTVGRGAGAVATNTAVGGGSAALGQNSTGTYNAGFGYNAGYTNLTGSYNSYFGAQAGNGNVGSQSYSTGLGAYALSGISTGAYNTAVGAYALQANTTASNNTAVGYQAGNSNTTGTEYALIGRSSGYSATTADYLTALGSQAGYSTTTGVSNTFVGAASAYFNTTGAYNTAVGKEALRSNTTASNNTAVGYQAGYTNITGVENTYIGRLSGYFATGSNNTCLGVNAGYNLTTGAKNTIIGAYTGNQGGLDIRTASNYIVLSDGDGNPRAYWNGAAATFNGGLAVTGTLSATGNMSVGATLASWDSGYKATQYSWGSVIADNTYLGSISLGSNIYATGNETFSTVSAGTYYGARYRMDSNGAHKWYTSSAAVSAGAVTMTNTMTLGAAGGLAVTGTLSATLDAAIGQATSSFPSGGGMEIYNATAPRLKLTNSTTGTASTDGTHLLVSGSDFYIQQREAASVIIATNGTNAVTVDASQNVGIGANISGSYKLEVNGNIVARRTTDNNPHFFSMSNSGSVCFLETINGLAASYLPINFKQTHTSTSQTPMVLDASGNLLVGCTALGAASGFGVGPNSGSSFIDICHVTATPSGSSYARFFYNSSPIGSITQSGTTAVLYNTTSDQRLKENIVDADSASSLIDSLQVRKFDWKSDNSHQRYGFVAQELVTVAPEAVHQPNDPDEMMAVDYSKLVPMLVKEIQSLRKRLTALEAK